MKDVIFRAPRIKVVVFDLDGTLTKSKLPLDSRMVLLLLRLLKEKKVAIVGGGKINLFKRQILQKLPARSKLFQNLFLFPTNGTAFYSYKNKWKVIYKHSIPVRGKQQIRLALQKALYQVGYRRPKRIYGRLIEDRGTQITFSGVGQRAPLSVKEKWHKTSDKRLRASSLLKRMLPHFEVRIGGLTSIDITPKGIDKAYAIRQIKKTLHVARKEMIFIGDAIYPGGNDYAVVKTGVQYIKISGPSTTKRIMQRLLRT